MALTGPSRVGTAPQESQPLAPARGRALVRTWRDRRRAAAAAGRRARTVARLRAIDDARTALAGAAALVSSGWVQGAWFRVRDTSGRDRSIGTWELRTVEGRELVGACLVGAVVEAAGSGRRRRVRAVARSTRCGTACRRSAAGRGRRRSTW